MAGVGGGGDLGRLVVRIVTDLSELKDGLTKAQGEIKKASDSAGKNLAAITKTVAGVGAVIATAVTTAAVAASQYAVQIEKLSAQTGIGVEELQKLGFAAKLNQSSVEELSVGLRILANQMDEASKGTGTLADRFRSIGVSVTDMEGRLRPTQDVLLDLAEVFQRLPDGAQKSALAVDLFGRSGTNLIPFLNQGRSGLAALGVEAERLGVVIDARGIKKAAEFNDAMDKLRAAFQGLVNEIGVTLIPALQALVNILTELTAALTSGTRAVGEYLEGLKEIGRRLGIAKDFFIEFSNTVTKTMMTPFQPFFDNLQQSTDVVRELGREAIAAREEVEKIAESTTNAVNNATATLTPFQQAWQNLRQSVNQVGTEFGTALNFAQNFALTAGKAIQTNLSSAISNVILGTQSAKEAFAAFGRALVKALVDFVVQYIITQALTKTLASAATAFAVGLAAILAKAFAVPAALASLASFGGNAAPAQAGIASTVALSKALATIPAAAEGAVVDRPTLMLAGEAGPEAIVPLSRPGIFGGSQFGGMNINIHYYGGGKITRDEAAEIAAMIGEMTQDEMKRVA